MFFSSWLRLLKSALTLPPSRRPRRSPTRGGLPRFRPRLEALEDRCLLSAGALDPTFGNGGFVTNFPGGAEATAIQSDGKILVGGSSNGAFVVTRYNANGTLDTSFGSGGSTTVNLHHTKSNLDALTVDSTGHIVLAGYTETHSGGTDFALVRLNGNGSVDRTFGSKGEVLTAGGNNGSEWDAVAIDSDGKILTAGWGNNGQTGFGALARYNANGSLDSSFGGSGLIMTYLGGQAVFHALALQSDGKILVGGAEGPSNSVIGQFAVARFNTNGSLDGGFGSGGFVTTSIDGDTNAIWDTGVHGLAVQSNGMIVAAGTVQHIFGSPNYWTAEVALTRYDATGTLDPNFGQNGIALTPASSPTVYDAALDVGLQSDGKIVTGGYHYFETTGYSFEVERYTVGGVLDGTFGNGGIVTTPLGQGFAMALQPNGDIVMAGGSAVARYLPSAPEIGSFVASPNLVTAGNPVSVTASNISDANANSNIIQVAIYLDSNNDGTLEPSTDMLLGYAIETSPGVWTLTFSTNAYGLTAGTYKLFAQAQDSYGVLGDPIALTLTVQ